MMNFTFIAALLCTITGFFSYIISNIVWYKLTSGANVSCISSMSSSNTLVCEGFQFGNIKMTSNITNLPLKIKSVDVSDSGMYFCGCCNDDPTVLFSPQYLNVQGKLVVKCFMSILFCKGFQNGSFEMSSKTAIVFFKMYPILDCIFADYKNSCLISE
uniref:Ig-like domain-containing protein n=1 Tax=Acanthochromis polyacanthus TaxID=80966 RepID=A0A3Q1FFX8_9TELE